MRLRRGRPAPEPPPSGPGTYRQRVEPAAQEALVRRCIALAGTGANADELVEDMVQMIRADALNDHRCDVPAAQASQRALASSAAAELETLRVALAAAQDALAVAACLFTVCGGYAFPFVEDKLGNVTGGGHQNKLRFAAQLNRYDELRGIARRRPALWSASDVAHSWVVPDPLYAPGEFLPVVGVSSTTPYAFPVTAVWGAR